MFKKLLVGSLVVCMALFAGNAFAGASDFASGSGWAADPDSSYSSTWNDEATARALGGGGFEVSAETSGKHFAGASIYGKGKGYADTDTYAHDFGRTSIAGAESSVSGWAFAEGTTLAGFTDWCGLGVDSTIQGVTYFQGTISQSNLAQEVGYAGGDGGWARNASLVEFSNGRSFYDGKDFYGFNYESGYTEGYAKTEGHSRVSVDTTGNYQYFRGETCTTSYFDTNHKGDYINTWMSGVGEVIGGVTNGYGAFAGGSAGFSYNGYTDRASGAADVNATIQKTSHSTTVTVNASSNATLLDTARCSGGGCRN